MRKQDSYDGPEEAIEEASRSYRKNLWRDAETYVEVWCEKDALAGVILPITVKYDVPLMVARGFASETFCYEAIASRQGDDREYWVYYLADFDRSGQDAVRATEEKLRRFAEEDGIPVVFSTLALRPSQIERWGLPTREPKRQSPADRNWSYQYACELDAIPPDDLRDLVEEAINEHLPADHYETLKVIEASEREFMTSWMKGEGAVAG
jgi:hypothetical protein